MKTHEELDRIRKFYDEEYYSGGDVNPDAAKLPWHSRLVASRLGDLAGKSVLDIACGRGEWLAHLRDKGCRATGIDLSGTAIDSCRLRMPEGTFVCGPAESLPFEDAGFDLVTCLGSLEHFTDKPLALREMVRVAAPDAKFLILVPNAGFLTRRLGFYSGTNQAHIREDVLSLGQWNSLFEEAGLRVRARWRDLHMLNFAWINLGNTRTARMGRGLQALALATWPISWQYQVYHYCERAEEAAPR